MHKTLGDVRARGLKCDRVRVLQLYYFQSNSSRLLQIELRDNELQDVAERWSVRPLREQPKFNRLHSATAWTFCYAALIHTKATLLSPPPPHTHQIEPILTDKSTTNVICHYIPADPLLDVGCSSLGLAMEAVVKRVIRGSGQEVGAAPGPAAGSQQSCQPASLEEGSSLRIVS